jgi:hypothetical protein
VLNFEEAGDGADIIEGVDVFERIGNFSLGLSASFGMIEIPRSPMSISTGWILTFGGGIGIAGAADIAAAACCALAAADFAAFLPALVSSGSRVRYRSSIA